jgi:hypothetical protein
VSSVLDAAGRRRSPATLPGYHSGRPRRNKGIATRRTRRRARDRGRHAPHSRSPSRLAHASDDRRVVARRPRIQEALALAEHDLDRRRGNPARRAKRDHRGRARGTETKVIAPRPSPARAPRGRVEQIAPMRAMCSWIGHAPPRAPRGRFRPINGSQRRPPRSAGSRPVPAGDGTVARRSLPARGSAEPRSRGERTRGGVPGLPAWLSARALRGCREHPPFVGDSLEMFRAAVNETNPRSGD